ncbi:MAG: phage baseplate assembly protein [Pseudomonadota bacterium]
MGEVVLVIDGQDYAGWMGVKVKRALEEASASFELELTNRWPGSGDRRDLREHTPCALRLDGKTVIRGVIDKVAPRYSAATHVVKVGGRSLTGQLVDCSCIIPTGQLRGLSLAAIARRVAEPFGIEVVDLAGDTRPFPRVQVEQGETIFEVLERLARQRGVFLTDDAEGRLIIRRRSTDLQGALELGKNVLEAEAEFGGRDQYSEYTVKGQLEGADQWDGATSARGSGRAVDASVPIHRPLIVLAERQGDGISLGDRARHEAALRRGRARRWTYTIQSWLRPDGALWETAEEVEVTDSFMGLESERLLVIETEFSIDDGGEITRLTVAQPEGFDLREDKVAVKQAAAGWDAL